MYVIIFSSVHIITKKELVLKNYRLTVKEINGIVEVSKGSVKTILEENLGQRKINARLYLSNYRMNIKQIFIRNEIWIYTNDPATADQRWAKTEKTGQIKSKIMRLW